MFQNNRSKLAGKLKNHLLVIPAHSSMQYSADVPYPFRQDSNFWYLTGINEPDLVLLIDTSNGDERLLLPAQNDYQKEWDGENETLTFKKVSGIQQYDSLESLKTHLKSAQKRHVTIGYLAPLPEIVQPYGFYANPSRRRILQTIQEVEPEPTDVRGTIARLRQIKQPQEITAIQKAIDITAEALADVKARLSIFKTEKEIERALTIGFYGSEGDGHAFEPIIASGKNAATIHYKKNDAALEGHSLLLLDVGARFSGYAADISRVWAVGSPSDRQLEVYETLADIQQKALTMLKPGITVREFQKKVEDYAHKKQAAIGIHHDDYPHGVSHFLGFDVHDAGDYELPLSDGMVVTVEPGIYLPDEGIGVRIEDDVLITKSGTTVLSKAIPKSLGL